MVLGCLINVAQCRATQATIVDGKLRLDDFF
jgi:hypothetical protein